MDVSFLGGPHPQRGAGVLAPFAAEVGTWGREEVLALARGGDHPEARAVLQPGTALHTAAWIPELEEALGKPVPTANQVTVWEGLRLLDRTASCPALGALSDGRALGEPPLPRE
jgi:maleate cis-trans isomerase